MHQRIPVTGSHRRPVDVGLEAGAAGHEVADCHTAQHDRQRAAEEAAGQLSGAAVVAALMLLLADGAHVVGGDGVALVHHAVAVLRGLGSLYQSHAEGNAGSTMLLRVFVCKK